MAVSGAGDGPAGVELQPFASEAASEAAVVRDDHDGSSVPGVDRYLLPVVAVVVAVSLTPLAAELIRSRSRARRAAEGDIH